jgi:cytochrome c
MLSQNSLQLTKVPLLMDHVNVNRVAVTALGAVLFVMLLTASSNLLLSPRTPKVPGFALPTSGPATEAAAGPAEPEAPPLPTLLAKADATKGAQFAKVCQTCHNFEKGAGPKIGPPLFGVVGRPIASIPGFPYSDSLKGVGGNWTYEALNVMVGNPKKEASGTKMTYPGEKDPQKRADILAYLQTLSDSPVPFPK